MRQGSIFEKSREKSEPLATRVRPETLDEFVGQGHLLGEGKLLRDIIENDRVSSMIFWGPPGVGKTTLARIIANQTESEFINFSAVTSGIKEIKVVMKDAEQNLTFGVKTIVFVDEIHRFNKAQQDAFLPYVENGSIILIGATTENPSFEINSALLSRSKVFVLNQLEENDIVQLLKQAIASQRGFPSLTVKTDDEVLNSIASYANGDARVALNALEMAVLNGDKNGDTVSLKQDKLLDLIERKSFLYDKNGEEHYNVISALHKSMRNSDVDAAIYWLARMVESGEDPLYIARRLVRFASEDIGLADIRALELANTVFQSCQFLGMPECNVHLTQAVIYLSLAPKSNAVDAAYHRAKKDVYETFNEPVPLVIRNAPTQLMKDLRYGEDYQYAHDTEDKLTSMKTMPPSLEGHQYYLPTMQGNEKRFKERKEAIEKWHSEHDQ
ncbi:ATPase AAA [Enterococcus florum]|uniref:Replication-associated recombination protein A n=1 Tax=Enterococcus florum TaxID=2480627 RepID=A0A4P5PI93_9ENTE|nr:replication-associated recombination protein A [Enterococcus florum]GCF93093.1 ATPase AAA [Enterococcus florum]